MKKQEETQTIKRIFYSAYRNNKSENSLHYFQLYAMQEFMSCVWIHIFYLNTNQFDMDQSADVEQFIEPFLEDEQENLSQTPQTKLKKQPPDDEPLRSLAALGSKYHRRGTSSRRIKPTKYLCIKYCYPILKKVCASILQKHEDKMLRFECINKLKSILGNNQKKSDLAKFYIYLVQTNRKVKDCFLKKFCSKIKDIIDQLMMIKPETVDNTYLCYVLSCVVDQIKKLKEDQEDWMQLWKLTKRIKKQNLQDFIKSQQKQTSQTCRERESENFSKFLEEVECIKDQASQWRPYESGI